MKIPTLTPLWKLLFLAFFCAWSAPGGGVPEPEKGKPKPCPEITREAGGYFDAEQREASLRGFSNVPLIRKLQVLVIQRDHALGRRRWSAFDPRWMFNDETAMGLLIGGHSEGYQMKPVGGRRPRDGALRGARIKPLAQYDGIAAFVDRWESDVVRAGGLVSLAWTGKSHSRSDGKEITGRRRFIKRLMLELAFAYQLKNGVIPGEQPVHFTQSEQDVDWQLLPAYAEMVRFFDDVQAFQTQYRDFARARLGVRTPYMRWAGLEAVRATNLVLRAQGASTISMTGAMRAQDQNEREKRELVESSARMILDSGEKLYPLAALANAESGIGDLVHAGALMSNMENIADHFPQLDDFVDQLNLALAPLGIVLEKGPGISRWAIEWLVQIGAAQARQLRYTAQTFPGFQTADPDEPDFLVASSYLCLEAQKYASRKDLLFLVDLNDLIRRRLPN